MSYGIKTNRVYVTILNLVDREITNRSLHFLVSGNN